MFSFRSTTKFEILTFSNQNSPLCEFKTTLDESFQINNEKLWKEHIWFSLSILTSLLFCASNFHSWVIFSSQPQWTIVGSHHVGLLLQGWEGSCVKFRVNGSSKPFAPRFLRPSTHALNLGWRSEVILCRTDLCLEKRVDTSIQQNNLKFILPLISFFCIPQKTTVQDAAMLMQGCKWASL